MWHKRKTPHVLRIGNILYSSTHKTPEVGDFAPSVFVKLISQRNKTGIFRERKSVEHRAFFRKRYNTCENTTSVLQKVINYSPEGTTRPAPLSFREKKDLGANQTGSHTNTVGRKSCKMLRPQNAPAGQKRQTKLLYQDTDREKRGKRQTKLLYQGNFRPQILILSKRHRQGRGKNRMITRYTLAMFLTYNCIPHFTPTQYSAT